MQFLWTSVSPSVHWGAGLAGRCRLLLSEAGTVDQAGAEGREAVSPGAERRWFLDSASSPTWDGRSCTLRPFVPRAPESSQGRGR